MTEQGFTIHYVATREEARRLISKHKKFWVSNCGCREGKGTCGRSRMDVCLYFNRNFPSTGSHRKSITNAGVEAILDEAEAKHLVARPFRNEQDPGITDGICFCCDDCCSYFLNPAEKCDKGAYRESTDMNKCTHCGACVDVCYFNARTMKHDKLVINPDNCYGCGLCLDVCPEDCIQMKSVEGRASSVER